MLYIQRTGPSSLDFLCHFQPHISGFLYSQHSLWLHLNECALCPSTMQNDTIACWLLFRVVCLCALCNVYKINSGSIRRCLIIFSTIRIHIFECISAVCATDLFGRTCSCIIESQWEIIKYRKTKSSPQNLCAKRTRSRLKSQKQ